MPWWNAWSRFWQIANNEKPWEQQGGQQFSNSGTPIPWLGILIQFWQHLSTGQEHRLNKAIQISPRVDTNETRPTSRVAFFTCLAHFSGSPLQLFLNFRGHLFSKVAAAFGGKVDVIRLLNDINF